MTSIEKRETAERWEAGIQPKMENKASDGAFFTRPPAADIACRLTLDVLEENPPKHLAFLPANSLNESKSAKKDAVKHSAGAAEEKLGSSNLLVDWTSARTWRGLKTLDPAVGSGILPAALIAEMKRRARLAGAFVAFQSSAANSA